MVRGAQRSCWKTSGGEMLSRWWCGGAAKTSARCGVMVESREVLGVVLWCCEEKRQV